MEDWAIRDDWGLPRTGEVGTAVVALQVCSAGWRGDRCRRHRCRGL